MHKFLLIMAFPLLWGCSDKNSLKLLWHAPIASTIEPIVQNGTVYIQGIRAGHPEESQRLFALDALTGKEKWVSSDSLNMLYGESGGFVFFRNIAEHLVQLDARTGEKIFESQDTDTPLLHWIMNGDTMFVLNNSMEVVAIDNRQSRELWRVKLADRWLSESTLEQAGPYIIASGNYRGDEQFGRIWVLNESTGKEIWTFEPPESHDFSPLSVTVYDPYILATNTSPLKLKTYVLDIHTGKSIYNPIYAFDFKGRFNQTAYASGGAFDLPTGQRTGEVASWIPNSIIYKGMAWQRAFGSSGLSGFFLRTTYDGDYRGARNWVNTPSNSSIKGFNLQTGELVSQTKEYKYTEFSDLVEEGGILYHSSIAAMKEGKSGVWAYRMPD